MLNEQVECYNLTTGLLCYQRDFVARVRCLAISANDVYLAVWLDTGILYLIKLLTRTIFREQEIKPRPPESAVHCLSFSSNDEELIITKRVDEKVHIYHYLVLEGSRSGRLTCGLSKVCQAFLYSRLLPTFYFTLLTTSYSTKPMTRASLQVFIVRRKSYLALLLGRIVVFLYYTTGAIGY